MISKGRLQARLADRAPPRRPRRPNIKPTFGLVVEGDAEYAALPLLHKKKLIANCPPLKASNLGGVGSDRDPTGIAKLVVGRVIAHKVAGRHNVVVCIDREQRLVGPGAFAAQVAQALTTELLSRSANPAGVFVVIADRAFEAWLLADAAGLHARGHFSRPLQAQSYEGSMCAQQLKGTLELTTALGRAYAKTTDGPALFAALDLPVARSHKHGLGSRSLDKFLRTLGV